MYVMILGAPSAIHGDTLTVILPLVLRRAKARDVARLWGVVLAANTVGALVFAYVLARTQGVETTCTRRLATWGPMPEALLHCLVPSDTRRRWVEAHSSTSWL
jgi:formate/nitrite transporter FocA (FNT family)